MRYDHSVWNKQTKRLIIPSVIGGIVKGITTLGKCHFNEIKHTSTPWCNTCKEYAQEKWVHISIKRHMRIYIIDLVIIAQDRKQHNVYQQ